MKVSIIGGGGLVGSCAAFALQCGGTVSGIDLIDVSADLGNGCTVVQDVAASPSGTAAFTGYCDGGADPAGYALALTGTVTLRRTCGATMDTVTGTLGGRVAVVKQ